MNFSLGLFRLADDVLRGRASASRAGGVPLWALVLMILGFGMAYATVVIQARLQAFAHAALHHVKVVADQRQLLGVEQRQVGSGSEVDRCLRGAPVQRSAARMSILDVKHWIQLIQVTFSVSLNLFGLQKHIQQCV